MKMKPLHKVFLLLFVLLIYITQIYGQSVKLPLITEPQGNNWSLGTRYVKVPVHTKFRCAAANTVPAPKYYWTLNGTKIVSDEDTISVNENTGTLTTGTYFSKKYSGEYQCYAYNDYGTAMTPILRIYAADNDQFGDELNYSQTKVPISLYVKLDCANPPYSIPPWIFDWRRGRTKTERKPLEFVPFIQPNDDRILIDKEGAIHFLWTEAGDSFFYGCVVTHRIYYVTHRSLHVNELVVEQGTQHERAPELKYATKEVVVYAKENAELMCIFSYFSPTEKLVIKWLHNGEEVGSNSPNITLKSVQLPDSKRDDSGEYRCEAYLGSKTAYGIVNLKIVSPPTFLPGKSLVSSSFPVEKDAVFQCGTSSYETYSYPTVWFVNGAPILGCPEHEFECHTPLTNGLPRCINKKMVCNNEKNCPNDEDEHHGDCIICPESFESCQGECVPKGTICECVYPKFQCLDKMGCIDQKKYCDGNPDCKDGSDERMCPNGPDIVVGGYIIKSDRSQLIFKNLTLNQSRCFQCSSSNEYGTTIGDGCLTVIDKITVISGPNSTYYVEPGSVININIVATTDPMWTNQMNYTWTWYEAIEDENTGETTTVSNYLPTKDKAFPGVFTQTQENRTIKIVFPEVRRGEDKEQENASLFNQLIKRLYSVNIQHRYDKVQINFTINGKEILPPPVPIVETASTNLWFIALILGVLLLFIVIALIVCYMYRNRGGTYLLDKKEVKAGHDPEKELKDGFQDVGRVDDDNDDPHGEKISLSESVKNYYDSDDDPTGEYEGDLDTSKFNEEDGHIRVSRE